MGVIYALQHNATKKLYIGQTNDLYKRYALHLYELRSKKHRSKELQRDFDTYGEDFSIYVLEEIENLKERINYRGTSCAKGSAAELEWMVKYGTLENGYNIQDSRAKRMLNRIDKTFPLKEGMPKV